MLGKKKCYYRFFHDWLLTLATIQFLSCCIGFHSMNNRAASVCLSVCLSVCRLRKQLSVVVQSCNSRVIFKKLSKWNFDDLA